jgi:hypothetical protein
MTSVETYSQKLVLNQMACYLVACHKAGKVLPKPTPIRSTQFTVNLEQLDSFFKNSAPEGKQYEAAHFVSAVLLVGGNLK